MEWLMIIAFVVISILDSKKKSDQAKQQSAQRRQQTGGQQARPQAPKPASKQEGSFMGSLTEFLESLEDALDPDGDNAPAKRPVQKQTAPKSAMPKAGKTLMQSAAKKKKAEPQSAKKSPAQLPTKTLMEQRPDREKREEHTKVTASVKPLTANVKPLKNAFENDEHCEHRIQLNPNIQYSKQQQTAAVQQAAIVKTDGESIVQGIIWSEILGKPKAYQNQMRRMGR